MESQALPDYTPAITAQFRVIGPIHFHPKFIKCLFLYIFQLDKRVITSLSEKLKGRPLIIIMRPAASLTDC